MTPLPHALQYQVLGAASARLVAAIQQCAPDSGLELELQRQALDTAVYFLECAAAAVADWLVPPADASPRKTALQPGAALSCFPAMQQPLLLRLSSQTALLSSMQLCAGPTVVPWKNQVHQ
jgi:hypothetical protein